MCFVGTKRVAAGTKLGRSCRIGRDVNADPGSGRFGCFQGDIANLDRGGHPKAGEPLTIKICAEKRPGEARRRPGHPPFRQCFPIIVRARTRTAARRGRSTTARSAPASQSGGQRKNMLGVDPLSRPAHTAPRHRSGREPAPGPRPPTAPLGEPSPGINGSIARELVWSPGQCRARGRTTSMPAGRAAFPFRFRLCPPVGSIPSLY